MPCRHRNRDRNRNRYRASVVTSRLRLSIAIPIPMPIPNARVFQRQIEFDPHDQTLSRSILMHSCIRRIPAASPAKRVAITCEALIAAGNALSVSESGSESQSLSGFGCYKPIATLDCPSRGGCEQALGQALSVSAVSGCVPE